MIQEVDFVDKKKKKKKHTELDNELLDNDLNKKKKKHIEPDNELLDNGHRKKKKKHIEADNESQEDRPGKNKKESKDRKEVIQVVIAPMEETAEIEIAEKMKKKKKKKAQQSEDADATETSHQAFQSKTSYNYYKVHPATLAMTSKEVSEIHQSLQIKVYPEEEGMKFKPITNFDYLIPSLQGHCDYIHQYIKQKKFQTPSPIQSQCWPPLLAGLDVIGIAATGSGKTLTFLIPAILKLSILLKNVEHIKKINRSGIPSPLVLIIAPTRELAMQSHQVVSEIQGGPKGVCVYGGVSKQQQKQELRAGALIVVATPGRLIDLLDEQSLTLAGSSDLYFSPMDALKDVSFVIGVCCLVLDEADRMLDDGFEPSIRKILSMCPPSGPSLTDRQTVMFSATWPEEIRALAEKFLRPDTIRISIGSTELSANHRVTQIVECIEGYEKDKKLIGLLEKYHKSRTNRILIFVLYKKEAVTLQHSLQNKGYNVGGIHGDKSQNDRTAALEDFKTGRTPLLIATDVAARGLDIPQVEYVINYSFPLTVEDYVHRIGRTGRGGSSGISHTFFTDFDKSLAGSLVAVLQEANQEIPKEIYKYPLITKKKQSKLYGDFGPKTELLGKKATKITFDD